MKPGTAYHQMVAVIECASCRPGGEWRHPNPDGSPPREVVVGVSPCDRHRRMMVREGWTEPE